MDHMFYEIPEPVRPIFLAQLKGVIANDEPWAEAYAFQAKLVPPDLMARDRFFRWLAVEFPYRAAVLKIPPHTCYKWHVDRERLVTINMLLNDYGRSHSYFGAEDNGTTCRFVELKYKPATRYVFNCSIPHEVINFDLDRYVLGLQFEEGVTYEAVANYVCGAWEPAAA